MIPFLLSIVLIFDPCVQIMQRLKEAGHFKEAAFDLEYHAGELDQAEIDYLAAYILVSKKLHPTNQEKLDFLKLWGRIRK